MRPRSAFLAIAACLLFVFPISAADDEVLRYQIPPGWIDLVDPATDTSRIPEAPLNEARSGKYVVYAVDPSNLSAVGANASMNVIELPSTGPITMALMRSTAAESSNQAQAMNIEMDILDVKVVKLGDVDIGQIESRFGTSAGVMQLLQYLVPGKSKSATITYACLPAEFDRYRAIFEASALATAGAASHRRGIDFGRAFRAGAIGAVVGGIGSLLIALVAIVVAKRRSGATATVPAQQSASSMWDCPTCKRRVPMRISECRCGTSRPA